MHFRALCPSVMLATLHSGVVTSPFGSAAAADPPRETRKRRRWSWFDPREQDEDEKEAPSDEGENQKENRPPRSQPVAATGGKGSRPIVVKRPALEAPNGLRRSPCMSFSPFGRGIRYAPCSPPPPPAKTSRQRRAPPPPRAASISPPTPPPSPLATSPPDAAPTHAMVTVVPKSAAAPPAGHPALVRRHEQPIAGGFRSRGSLTALKSPLTMNPNQRFALVCLNDRFYWVSKEVDSAVPRVGRRPLPERQPHEG
ncbi:CASP-like protein 4A2 [Ischnura elegans]|uniref:CASP-like protein 4A2 n=1 Tax=Ischnura elegans TaxID=197161 RepID=UPI001ED8A321|nr:CASP-like protein 4A2 [Ischnura elegans]